MKPAQVVILTAWAVFGAVSLGCWLYGLAWNWALLFGAIAGAAVASRVTTIDG